VGSYDKVTTLYEDIDITYEEISSMISRTTDASYSDTSEAVYGNPDKSSLRFPVVILGSLCAATAPATDISHTKPTVALYSTSNSFIHVAENLRMKVADAVPAISTQVERVLTSLSLTKSQAANILGVTRPTLYSWLKTSEHGKVDENHRKRLLQIYSIACYWDQFGAGPLGDRVLVTFIDSQKSVLDLLVEEPLNLTDLKHRLKLLALSPGHGAQVPNASLGWRERFKNKGYIENSTEIQDDILAYNLRRIKYEG